METCHKDMVKAVSKGVIPQALAEIARTAKHGDESTFANWSDEDLFALDRAIEPFWKKEYAMVVSDNERFGSWQSEYLAFRLGSFVTEELSDRISLFYYGCKGY